MATNFPNSLDSLTNPATTDQLNSPSHAAQHANANDAIEQLQAKVGVNSSAVTTSHDYKIAQLEAAITAGVSGTKLIYQDVRNQSGVSLTKGTPVRVTGSDGASGKLLIGAASNSSEGGSSKTFGLLSSTLSNNSNGQVVTNGLLEGVDTTGAVDGDPVWLGVNGAKIFGLVNKPVAPAHLVYLGVVVRGGQQNTGSIFVSIQNGFEVDELHNVLINNATLQNKDALVYDSTTQLWKNYDLSNDFVLAGDLQNSLGDYIPLNVLGQPSGPAALDADGNLIVPENKIIIEGATADANELTIQAPDVASDITVTLPNATGTLALTSDITTAVNNLVNSAPNTLDTLNELATALGNDANFATTTATSIGNKVSKAGGDVITSSLPGVIGLRIKGAASQTANLTQWQDSSGSVLSRVQADGTFVWGSASSALQNSSGRLIVNLGSAASVGVTVKGAASQTANLQEWQNSAGTILAYIDKDGQILTPRVNLPANGLIVEGGTGPYIQMGSSATYLYTRSASNKGLVIQGSISQTANLQEWQDPYGGVKASFDNNGRYNLNAVYGSNFYGRLNVAGSSSDGYALDVGTINGNTPGVAQRISLNNNSDIGLIITGYGSYQHTGDLLRIDGTKGDGGGDFFRVNASGAVQAYSATQKGLTVKGFASQTANLQEWQNSAGTVLAKVDSSGSITSNISFAVNNTSGNAIFSVSPYSEISMPGVIYGGLYTSAKLNLLTNSTSTIGAIIRGQASQTADLQQWQNSSGTVLAKIAANGQIYNDVSGAEPLIIKSAGNTRFELNQYAQGWSDTAFTFGSYYNTDSGTLPRLSVFSGTAGTKGIIVRGAASQTANLQEWHNSAGTVLANVDSTGAMFTTTAAANTNTTQVATTAYVQTELADLVNSAPATLDTLKELSDALGADANFATTVTNNLALKAPLASPTLTGTPTAPTAAVGTDTTQIATTAFVIDQIDASTQPGALYQTTAPANPEVGQIWIDSDDNVTVFDSNIIRRQPFTATAGQTNFVTTVPFIDGFEQVYFNGLLLLKTTDYTTSGNNTVILGSAAAVGDIIEVVTVTNLNSVNTYTQAETNALIAANSYISPVSISANTNLLAKKRYFVTSASALTLTLPASPTLNDEIQILDASGNASTYNITVARNGNLINGNAGNLIIDNNGGWYTLLYTGATYGWKVG